ncbi:phosphorylase family protein [Leptolyngbya sp. NIES-2104]|uniref:phosphorylase family protein n=1 Tax=Leptolyngbya sp. NIES-2104 TaxID=1552121 RepID=UPI00073F04EC|nr:TIR domain-containing protein [Leptolyngbya sp. NIES-2104]
MPCAVILTALSAEYLAVRARLSNLREDIHPQQTIYERGEFFANEQMWDVGIVEIGAGNPSAALEAERAIAYFNPDIILFIGVAGGIKDVQLGDVVAATEVYGYEFGRAEAKFKARSRSRDADYGLEQRAKAEARKPDWLKRLASVPSPAPRVFVAPIAAGEKVIADTRSQIYQLLRSQYEAAIAVEMEGLGFLEAVRANKQVEAIVIRGISDLIDHKQESDKAGYQDIAAHHASAFAFEMLAKLQSKPRVPKSSSAATSGMRQDNAGGAQGWQTVVQQGGTAYIGNIHFHNASAEKPSQSGTTKMNTAPKTSEVEIFFSYAHEDEVLRDKLATHLTTLQRQGIIRQWHDRQIGAGKEWEGEIDRHLNTAHVILLLVSADFIASDYCFDKEVKRAMERHAVGEARVIPIVLRPVDLDGMPFNKLQTLPKDRKPVTTWANQDEAFLDIAKGIRTAIKEMTQNP